MMKFPAAVSRSADMRRPFSRRLHRGILESFGRLFTVAALVLLSLSWAHSVVIEDFSSTTTFTLDINSGASASIDSVTGISGSALQLGYSLGSGSFVQFVRDYGSRDFAAEGGNSVRFRYKALGNSNSLEVKFTDSDSTGSATDKLDVTFLTNPDGQWRTVTLAFSTFTVFNDGTSAFDLSAVSKMLFGVTGLNSSRAPGSVFIDKVELFRSTWTLIDNFDDGSDPNFFGGDTDAFGGTPDASQSYIVESNGRVLKFTYSVLNASENAFLTVSLENRNYEGYNHLSFRIRGESGGEVLKMKLESPTGVDEVFISTYLAAGITSSFQEVLIPLTAFPNVDLSSVTVFTIVAQKEFSSGAGSVFIDDLAFARVGETPGVVQVLDEMDDDISLSNWDGFSHRDASINISVVSDATVPGASASNRVYRLDYDFTTSPSLPAEIPFAVMERPFQLSLAPFKGVRFQFKGTDAANNLELKLTDSDDTTWVRRFLLVTDTNGSWKTATVPFEQFAFFSSGDDSKLNLKKIKKIWFAIVKGSGGSGTFTVDDLESLDSGTALVSTPGRLISSVKVVNNPFSPNGDGVKDEIFFVYTLESESKVNLKIYNMQGDVIMTVANQQQLAGEQSLSWNGIDKHGDRISNGMYLFRLEAEGVDNRKDVVRQVVVVLR